MEDFQIVELFFNRDENAITQTAQKYGSYCNAIAYNILGNSQDAEECVNDAYLKIWDTIPPLRPNSFSAFIGKITRNLALNRYKHSKAKKRFTGETESVFDEVTGIVSQNDFSQNVIDEMALTEVINSFLESLSSENRKIFIQRYWYVCPIKEIARNCSIGESKVKMILMRERNALKKFLEKEGISL